LTVEDGGHGLDESGVARLGQRFQRGADAAAPGSGLGWSIVKRIAALQGWAVAADRSPALGGLRVELAPEKSSGDLSTAAS
jgi:signal transduction histidine kinase